MRFLCNNTKLICTVSRDVFGLLFAELIWVESKDNLVKIRDLKTDYGAYLSNFINRMEYDFYYDLQEQSTSDAIYLGMST